MNWKLSFSNISSFEVFQIIATREAYSMQEQQNKGNSAYCSNTWL